MTLFVRLAIVVLVAIGAALAALAMDLVQLPGRLSGSAVAAALSERAAVIEAGGAVFDETVTQTSAVVEGQTLRVTGTALIDPESVDGSFLGARQSRAIEMLCSDPALYQLLLSGAVFTWRWSGPDGEDIGGNTLAGTAACAANGY